MRGRGAGRAGRAGVPALVLALALAPGTQTMAAYQPPAGTVEYTIHHSKYDVIGTHGVSFSRGADELTVNVVIQIKVKLLFITAHSLESERREVWRGGRLVAYRARTDENSKLFNVSARMEGDSLVISGSNGTTRTQQPVFPTHPWNPEIVNQRLLMDTKTGELLEVSTKAAGEDTVEVAGVPVRTRRYVMSGGLDRELWFDESGNWIQMKFKNDGATLTFTRSTPLR